MRHGFRAGDGTNGREHSGLERGNGARKELDKIAEPER